MGKLRLTELTDGFVGDELRLRLRCRQMFWRWLEVVLDSGSGVRSTQLIGAGGGGLREFIRADYLTVECVLNDLGIRQWIPLLVRWGLGRKVSSDVVLQGEALLCALSELVKNEVVN